MNAQVRLSEVVVKNLFGWLSYDIRLNDDMSFLLGPNGCGKTTILNMIDFILDPSSGRKLDKFYNIPFDEVSLTFSDGNTLGLKRNKRETDRIRYFYQKGSGKRHYFKGCMFPHWQAWKDVIPFELNGGSVLIPEINSIRDFYWPEGKYFDQESRDFIVTTINSLFRATGKEVSFDKNDRITIQQGKSEIDKEHLSFGEQYILNTMLKLVDIASGHLVLIDLPESSLHIEIQEKFADLVYDISIKHDLQVVIVTHSPSIVNGHLEWYADRKWTDKRQTKVATST